MTELELLLEKGMRDPELLLEITTGRPTSTSGSRCRTTSPSTTSTTTEPSTSTSPKHPRESPPADTL